MYKKLSIRQLTQLVLALCCMCFLCLDDSFILQLLETTEGSDVTQDVTLIERSANLLCFSTATGEAAHVIRQTWGKRCNHLVLFNTSQVASDGSNFSEWEHNRQLLRTLYHEELSKADWFLYVPNNTFAIPENARLALKGRNPAKATWMGCVLQGEKMKFVAVDGGYILSKEGLRKLVQEGIEDPSRCSPDGYGRRDLELAKCLRSVGIDPEDGLDEHGRERFLPFGLEEHFGPPINPPKDIQKYLLSPKDEFSSTAITISGVDEELMYVIDHFLYKLRPYGIRLKSKLF